MHPTLCIMLDLFIGFYSCLPIFDISCLVMQKSDFTLCSLSTLHTLNRKMSLSVCSLKDVVGLCFSLTWTVPQQRMSWNTCCVAARGSSIGCDEKNPYYVSCLLSCYWKLWWLSGQFWVSAFWQSLNLIYFRVIRTLAHPNMKPSSSICCITVTGSTGTCTLAALIVCVLSLSLHACFPTSLPPFCLLQWFSLSYLPVALPFCLISQSF